MGDFHTQPDNADDCGDSFQYLGQLTRRGHYAREKELAALRYRVEELTMALDHAKAMQEVWMNRARQAEAPAMPLENRS